MITSLEVENIIYNIINIPIVTENISGKIFKAFRPPERQEEDIVIGCLTNSDKVVQNGFSNINIYVPSLGIRIPNYKRFEKILEIINIVLKIGKEDNFYFKIDNISTVLEDSDNKEMNYVNIRINYQIR